MSVFIPVPKKGNAEEICMQIKKKQLELDMEQWTGSKLGKESEKAVYCHPVTLYIVNVYAENIMQNARLEESQVGIQISRWNVNNLRYVDDTTLMAENEEELRSLSMKGKEESEKAGLKFNFQTTKIMASGPISSWQIEGRKVEAVTDFISLDSRSLQTVSTAMKLRNTCSLKGKL